MKKDTERFLTLPATVISDALEKMGLAGAVGNLLEVSKVPRVAGRAVTMKLEPSNAPSRVHLGAKAIKAATPGDIIVVANRARTGAACWGGLLTLGAKCQGVAGVLVDGLVRDVEELRGLGLPILARGATPLSARGRFVEVGANIPVDVGGVPVNPGDIVVMDASGAVIVPADREDEVFKIAHEIQAVEAGFEAELKAGIEATKVLDRRYELLTGVRK